MQSWAQFGRALAGARGRNATDDSLIEWFPAVKSNATRFEKLRARLHEPAPRFEYGAWSEQDQANVESSAF